MSKNIIDILNPSVGYITKKLVYEINSVTPKER